ncbi:hypothetical protein BDF14DRAFT_1777837 [Spinellus fusiger]|nr:hypothetical protein BDF14DRAFT_1777837 [Spinellus fusiger]
MSFSYKPSLPSIQFLLQDSHEKRTVVRHQSTRSLSSLPSELQNLSLNSPHPYTADASWLQGPGLPSALPVLPPVPQKSHPIYASTHRRPPGATHGRSSSDLSLLPTTRPLHQTHRRTASATSADVYQKPYPIRPYSNSPPSQHTPSPHQGLFDALNMQEKKTDIAEDELTGRYGCQFCSKKFSRPSSLRIHTYSHTGEKPFVCPEESCGRKFSVQSNMRRHLKVHRLGKSKATPL